jgi:hypothetical protein
MKRFILTVLIISSLVLIGCREESISGSTVVDVVIGCEDSDGGLNKDVKGVVTVGDEEYSDECVAGLLIEYYCDNGNKANQNVRCENKCSGGKCI